MHRCAAPCDPPLSFLQEGDHDGLNAWGPDTVKALPCWARAGVEPRQSHGPSGDRGAQDEQGGGSECGPGRGKTPNKT